MKIASYQVEQASSHVYASVASVTQKIVAQPARAEPRDTLEQAEQQPEKSALEQAGEQAKKKARNPEPGPAARLGSLSAARASPMHNLAQPRNPTELKLSLLLRMIRALTGKEFEVQPIEPEFSTPSTLDLPALPSGGGRPAAQGLRVEQTSFFYEREATEYRAQGIVQTADGQTLAFDLSLSMSREFMAYSQTAFDLQPAVNVCDPLVVNYGGTAASLQDTKFSFDLDADGTSERISFVGQGSGFLALDKNGDGTINDGNELFGTQSGDGFADLRVYDGDGNGWIDENDAVYSQLRVWVRDENGEDRLYALKELDVGALYLGAMDTPFTLGGSQADGYVRSTSFFLKDSGGAGTVQHVDLVI